MVTRGKMAVPGETLTPALFQDGRGGKEEGVPFSPWRFSARPFERLSNCLESQDFVGSRCLVVSQGDRSRTMTLRIVRSFRMEATRATFLGLPAWQSLL